MQRLILFVVILMAATSCKNNNTSEVSDTKSESTVIADTVKPFENIGMWNALVMTSKKSNGGKLLVTGDINIKSSTSSKLTLNKTSVSNGELTLAISQEPEVDGKKASVKYDEELEKPGQYNKVNIEYNRKLVAVIENITTSK